MRDVFFIGYMVIAIILLSLAVIVIFLERNGGEK